MALPGTQDNVKRVPWFSPMEWHDVYRQIYSNNMEEQTKAYERLLAWKARMPKLPAGVDCTLSILQVCLRDREWTSKIDSGELPMYCENDLSLMYSTIIMRFLNHFCNIGHTKQTSLFKIANQLKIPEWIVSLRHEAAHGHELPSIGVLRIAINILLHWLHDEYWAPEARAMEKCYMKETYTLEKEEFEETQILDMIELWTAVSLYINAGFKLVSDLPETQLREILQDLRDMLSQYKSKTSDSEENEYISIYKKTIKIEKQYSLQTAQILLLSKISVDLSEDESSSTTRKKCDAICNALCNNKVFLSTLDVLQIFRQKGKKNINMRKKILPLRMLQFWKDIIFLLHRENMLEALLFKLLNIVNQECESKERRNLAALWISSVFYSFVQLNLAQDISHSIEYESQMSSMKLTTKTLNQHLKEHIHSNHPYLRKVLWLDISSIIPHFVFDINFLSRLLLNVNEFSARLIQPLLKLVTPKINVQTKRKLLNLLEIYIFQENDNNKNNDDNDLCDKVFSVEDFDPIEHGIQIHKMECAIEQKPMLADQTIRNPHWKFAHGNYQWIECPIGLLPWQIDSLKYLEPLEVKPSRSPTSVLDSQIIAGMVNRKNLKMCSRIKWDNILRKKRRIQKKRNKDIADIIMNRALEITKNQT
ncbi:hypothetical protein P5V15_013277 [Pogonomyrmex californicus]